jgi:hypothetical protein
MSLPVRATRPYMPGYELSPDERRLRPFAWAAQILRDAHNYWVATGRPDGRPHVMPVWAVWHQSALWFSTGAQSRKARNLAELAECCVGAQDGKNVVILEGVAERLAATEAPPEVPRDYAAKYGEGYPPDSLVFRVAPRVAFGFSEAAEEFSETATRWLFEDA